MANKLTGANTDGSISDYGFLKADEVLKELNDKNPTGLVAMGYADIRELIGLAVDQAQKDLY